MEGSALWETHKSVLENKSERGVPPDCSETAGVVLISFLLPYAKGVGPNPAGQ